MPADRRTDRSEYKICDHANLPGKKIPTIICIYWIENGVKITPAILKKVTPFSDLEMFLQRRYGAQSYCAIIRRGKKMILKHIFHIAQPLKFTPEADIRAEIEILRRAERGDFVGAEL